jgi:hypothetical protein
MTLYTVYTFKFIFNLNHEINLLQIERKQEKEEVRPEEEQILTNRTRKTSQTNT